MKGGVNTTVFDAYEALNAHIFWSMALSSDSKEIERLGIACPKCLNALKTCLAAERLIGSPMESNAKVEGTNLLKGAVEKLFGCVNCNHKKSPETVRVVPIPFTELL